ncbi:hypothetical protein F4604DRAFT_1593080, partial [Suillus subluteus]
MSITCKEPTETKDRAWEIGDVPLGDPIAEWAERLLMLHAPYPGDDLEKEESFSGQRFVVYKTSKTHHVILDGAQRLEDDLLVPSSLLRNPMFQLGDWYTTHIARHFELPKHLVCLMHNGEIMADPVSMKISEILNNEENFP